MVIEPFSSTAKVSPPAEPMSGASLTGLTVTAIDCGSDVAVSPLGLVEVAVTLTEKSSLESAPGVTVRFVS